RAGALENPSFDGAQARRVTCWTPRHSQPVKGSALDILHPCGPPAADRETSAGWVAVASDRDMGNARWGPRPGRALAWLDSIFLARFARLVRYAGPTTGTKFSLGAAYRTK